MIEALKQALYPSNWVSIRNPCGQGFIDAQVAAESLGGRRFQPAIPKLKHLALNGVSNARTAALGALCDFPSPEMLRFAIDLQTHPSMRGENPHAVMSLLAANDCKVMYTKTHEGWFNIRYRMPRSDEWHKLIEL